MKKTFVLAALLTIVVSSCIDKDYVAPKLHRITVSASDTVRLTTFVNRNGSDVWSGLIVNKTFSVLMNKPVHVDAIFDSTYTCINDSCRLMMINERFSIVTK